MRTGQTRGMAAASPAVTCVTSTVGTVGEVDVAGGEATRGGWMSPTAGSHRPHHSDDLAAESYAPGTVGVQAQPIKLPVSVLGVICQELPSGLPGSSTRDVHIQVGVVRHSD